MDNKNKKNPAYGTLWAWRRSLVKSMCRITKTQPEVYGVSVYDPWIHSPCQQFSLSLLEAKMAGADSLCQKVVKSSSRGKWQSFCLVFVSTLKQISLNLKTFFKKFKQKAHFDKFSLLILFKAALYHENRPQTPKNSFNTVHISTKGETS